MGFEVEIKFASPGFEDVVRRLESLKATPEPPLEQEDVYLAHPCRDFAKTNEAFRIRREGPTNRITYKGPKLEGPTKTREEFEVEFASGLKSFETLRAVFDRLGFRPVASVRKTRRPYHVVRDGIAIAVCLDVAHEIGEFVEVEALAAFPHDLPAARSTVMKLSEELGLFLPEPRSYLRMLLETRGAIASST